MAVISTHHFDVSPANTTLTTGNTGLSGFAGVGTAKSTATAVLGGFAAEFVTSGSQTIYGFKTVTLSGLGGERFYGHMDAAPPAAAFLSTCLSGATLRAGMRINTDRTITLRNNVTAVATSTTALPTGAYWRVDWLIDNANSTQTAHIFIGSNVHGTTPDETISGTYNQGTFDTWRVGHTIGVTSWTLRIDEAEFDDAVAPGPAAVAYTGSPADTVGVLDTAARAVAAARSVGDAVGVTDSVSRTAAAARTIGDPVGVTDSVSATRGATRAAADTVGLSDIAAQALTAVRAVADPVGVTDSVSVQLSGALSASKNDPVGITDAVSRTAASARTVTDAVGVTDATAIAAIRVLPTDPVGITDAVTAAVSRSRTVADSVGVTDATTKTRAVARTVADLIGVQDVAGRTANPNAIGVIGDSLLYQAGAGVADLNTRIIAKGWADPNTELDGLVGRSISGEAVTPSSITVVRTWRAAGFNPRVWVIALGTNNKNATEAQWDSAIQLLLDEIGPGHKIYWVGLGFQNASDSRVLAFNINLAQIAAARPDSDMVALDWNAATECPHSDASKWDATDAEGIHMTRAGYDIRDQWIADQIASEAPTDPHAEPADAVTVTDTATRTIAAARSVANPLGLSDAVTAALTRSRVASDGVSLSDTAVRVMAAGRTLADLLGLSDGATTLVTAARGLADSVGLTDSVTATLTAPVAPVTAAAHSIQRTTTSTAIRNDSVAQSVTAGAAGTVRRTT